MTDLMFIKTSPCLHQPFSNCTIVCCCFVARVIPEGVVCSGSPPSLHWFSFMPGACLSSGWGAQQPVCEANSRVISGHSLGEHIFVCFSPELGRRGMSLCSLNEALFSAEEMKS